MLWRCHDALEFTEGESDSLVADVGDLVALTQHRLRIDLQGGQALLALGGLSEHLASGADGVGASAELERPFASDAVHEQIEELEQDRVGAIDGEPQLG